MMGGEGGEGATLDALMDGGVSLWQSRDGYRAGIDAALLAAAAEAALPLLAKAPAILDVGCGPGAVVVALCARLRSAPEARFAGIEKCPQAFGLLQANLAHNDLGRRIKAYCGDALDPPQALHADFDLVVSNPPYFDAPDSAPEGPRRTAWLNEAGLEAWIKAMLSFVRGRGHLLLIQRADQLPAILSALHKRAGGVRVRAVQPFEDRPAKLILVLARKGVKSGFRLLPPFVLHDRLENAHGRKYRGEVEQILRGGRFPAWD